MSFYIYYGKLGTELLVAILPNGTVEVDDTIYLSSKKDLLAYRVQDVASNDDGGDCITFRERDYSYKLVSVRNYQQLNLIRTGEKGEKVTTSLTRKYAQDGKEIQTSNKPRIWTGAFDFHTWAKDEEIVVVAPKGMGNRKPIVCLWQWTKDAENKEGTLSHSVSDQVSEPGRPNNFTFKQNGFYTLTCQVNSATDGLKLAIKGPKEAGSNNSEVSQKELTSAKVDIGAEHRFTPPAATEPKKVSLDCFVPMAKPSLPRITKPLPFPAGLIETLSYSAAYVDQAGYLAQYAISQFNQLDSSYHKLEKKLEAKATRLAKLEEQNSGLRADKTKLDREKAELAKQLKKTREEAKKREDELQGKLNHARAHNESARVENSSLRAYIKKLEAYIEKDKLADIELERQFKEHDAADEAEIARAHAELLAANQTIATLVEEVDEKKQTIVSLRSDLQVAKDQLAAADATICVLSVELASEKEHVAELASKLDLAQHQLSHAEAEIKFLRNENGVLASDLADANHKAAELEQQIAKLQAELKEKKEQLAIVEGNYEKAQEQLAIVEGNYEKAQEQLDDTKDALEIANAELEQKSNEEVRLNAAIERLKEDVREEQEANKENYDLVLKARKDQKAIQSDFDKYKIDSQSAYNKLKDMLNRPQRHASETAAKPLAAEPLKQDVVIKSSEISAV